MVDGLDEPRPCINVKCITSNFLWVPAVFATPGNIDGRRHVTVVETNKLQLRKGPCALHPRADPHAPTGRECRDVMRWARAFIYGQ